MSFHFSESIRHYCISVYDDHLSVASRLRLGNELVFVGLRLVDDEGFLPFSQRLTIRISEHFRWLGLTFTPHLEAHFVDVLCKAFELRYQSQQDPEFPALRIKQYCLDFETPAMKR